MRRLVKCLFLLPEDMTNFQLVGLLTEGGFDLTAESPQEFVFSVPREITPKKLEKNVKIPIAQQLEDMFPKGNCN